MCIYREERKELHTNKKQKIVEYNKSEEIDVQVEGSRHDSEAKLEVGLGEMEI